MINVATSPARPLVPFWNLCVGAGRASEGLRAAWQNQLAQAVKDCGFQYIRFHGLFNDDMFVYRELNGKPVFNFQYIDELFDTLLGLGIKPFVELGFMPTAMATGTTTIFWWKGNVTPPKSWDLWGELVSRFTQHVVDRYGLAEVKTWYFEVWNEANITGSFWTGTRSEYFHLYKVSVQAIKAVHPELRVGGPATSGFQADGINEGELLDRSKSLPPSDTPIDELPWKPVWVEEFLNYCAQEKLPVDFVSTHPYPTDFALDEGVFVPNSRYLHATRDDLTQVRRLVDKSAYPQAEIHLTEWSNSPSPRDYSHDFNPQAAFIVAANLDSTGLANSLSYWVFSDIFEEKGAGDTPFHGGFGLINYQGIKKPAYHAYRFLNQLGDQELHREDGLIVTRQASTGRHTALFYHYPLESSLPGCKSDDLSAIHDAEKRAASGQPRTFRLQLSGLKPGARFSVETIDESCCVMPLFRQLGYPSCLTPAEIALMRSVADHGQLALLVADERGQLDQEFVLPAWALLLVKEI